MPPSEAEHQLVICMGSSCFARGNVRAVEAAREFLREHQLEDKVRLTGTLCQDRCCRGPNLTFDGECHCEVDPATLPALLDELMNTRLR